MKRAIFYILLCSPSYGSITGLSKVGATSTQIVISYTAPNASPCTIEASKESDFTPLAKDVDDTASDGTPIYYAGSSSDSRSGNITTGRYRVAVIGKQGASAIELASDGYNHSRALQADKLYYIRVTCGVDVSSITAKTSNILLGSTRGEAMAVESPYKYKKVSKNPVAVTEYNDPYLGTLVKRHSKLLGYGYVVSTLDAFSSTMPDATARADCGKTLPGVKGSCIFSSATASGWTTSTTTLTAAIRSTDTYSASYSGTSQDKLYLKLGTGKVPDNTSFDEAFSFQNIVIVGSTTDTSNGGGEIEVCVTMDGETGECDSPWKTVSLITSTATYRVCNDSPCTVPDTAGDFMTRDDPTLRSKFGKSRIYTVGGASTTVRFTGENALSDCNNLDIGENFYAQNTSVGGYPVYGFTVVSTNCALSPPQVTTSQNNDISNNGTVGVGFFLHEGIGSKNYGIFIRKKSATSSSTISIDYALWRAAWSWLTTLNFASGGFGKKCQTVPTSSGYYLCTTGHFGGIIGVKPVEDGLDIVNYGWPYYRGDLLIGSALSATYIGCTAGGNDMSWDDVTPGRLYCSFETTYPNPASGGAVDNRKAVVLIDLDLVERSTGNPDGYTEGGGIQGASVSTATILNPCLGSCSSVNDDYTSIAQVKRQFPTYDQSRFGLPASGSPMGNTLFLGSGAGSQNSAGWMFAFDLGNRLPIGSGYVGSYGNTQNVFGGILSSNTPMTRWCNFHTGQNPAKDGGAKYTIPEVSAGGCTMFFTSTNTLSSCSANANPGTCDPCPSVTLDGFDYTGKNWCSTILTTSTWQSSWGATPGDWETGDPVQSGCSVSPNFHYDQKLQLGDYIAHDGEIMRIIEKTNNVSYKVVRGFGSWYDNGIFAAKAHSINSSFFPVCYGLPGDPTKDNPNAERGSLVWYFEDDPTGQDTDYTFLTNYHNHAFHFDDGSYSYGVVPNKSTTINNGLLAGKFANASEYKPLFAGTGWGYGTPDTDIGWLDSFSGKNSACYGNACETHPGAQHVDGTAIEKQWFHDVRPRLFHRGTLTVTQVVGTTYTYRVDGSGAYIDPKHYEQEVFSASHPLQRADVLTDDAAGAGKYCLAIVANDCFSGSTAGKFYFVSQAYDTTWGPLGGCRESLFDPIQADICAGNTAGHSSSFLQVKFPEANGLVLRNGVGTRAIAKEGLKYHDSATTNVHSDPSGKSLLTRGFDYLVPPMFPGGDSRNRATFYPIKVSIPSVPAGTDNVYVEFGNTPDFYCSKNRDNACIAQSATINEADPYKFSHETITGLSCASGCSITIPALPNRVLYYRVKYRDSGGNVISTGQTEIKALP